MTPTKKDEIRRLVEEVGIYSLLEAVSEICYEKALSLPRDDKAGKSWKYDAIQIEQLVNRVYDTPSTLL